MSTSHIAILCIIVISHFPLHESADPPTGSLDPSFCLPLNCALNRGGRCSCCSGMPKKCYATNQECAAACKRPPPPSKRS
ncbi:hypothetical protein EUTSA_v10010876mg [Eutrema salsugineum]|uniref:Uncharacterized protein n=1 Tax=Eutrema salsugineum TaxID=72664 RepID=V4LPR2_EUTSA|nr:EMBRYO SURROUNDING FACTOR 1-like protein 10 [Eutrema salsugineum]ESQ45789.1 hypothetical protein EUTSA_v10010876mg [Eutrema salsugineum]